MSVGVTALKPIQNTGAASGENREVTVSLFTPEMIRLTPRPTSVRYEVLCRPSLQYIDLPSIILRTRGSAMPLTVNVMKLIG
jgi:hypothetical protein